MTDMESPLTDASRTGEIVVRPVARDDLPAIREIANWAIRNTAAIFRSEPDTLAYWTRLWEDTRDRHPWLAAACDGSVVGFARSSSFMGRCGFASAAEVSVYVRHDRRGGGIGRALYARLIPRLRAQGYRSLVAEIARPNPASERLHGVFGFEKVGELKRLGWKRNRWHDVAFWQLMLQEDDGPPVRIKRCIDIPFERSKPMSEENARSGKPDDRVAAESADSAESAESAESRQRIRDTVSRVYARAVEATPDGGECAHEQKGVLAKFAGYERSEVEALPRGAVVNSFGCGNPVALSRLREGETVLDLGCGAGMDLLLAAKRVGPSGRVIGVDMTDEMIAKAREVIAEAGAENVEIRKGLIEDLPVSSSSVDWVISNCVVNLSPEKDRVFAEIARVLRPGGRMSISDIIVEGLPDELRSHTGLYCSCVAGAISEQEYLDCLHRAGLADAQVRERVEYGADSLEAVAKADCSAAGSSCCSPDDDLDVRRIPELAEKIEGKVFSARIHARKPGNADAAPREER